jgi:cobalt-zinc-cadmium efflux system outer membrane protein
VAWLFTAIALLATPHDVTLAQARAEALERAPQVVLAKGRADVVKTEIAVAGALPNPSLGVTTARETAKFGASVGVPLLLFGQRGTAMRAAEADADAATLDAAAVQREARWNATIAWVDLWEAEARGHLLELARSDAGAVNDVARRKFTEGSGPRVDVVRTQADLARAGAEADAADRVGYAAAARLAVVLGREPSDRLRPAGAPVSPAALPIFDDLAARLSTHPELVRDRAQMGAAERHADAERRARWPVVTPGLTVNYGDPTLPGTDIIFGLSFDVPVLNQRQGPIARAEAQRALAQETLAQDERRLRTELLDAYRRAEAARARLQALRDEVLPAMKEARNMTQEGFQSGRIDLLHLIDAQRAYLENQLAEVEANAAFSRALADLERAAGADLPQEEPHAP